MRRLAHPALHSTGLAAAAASSRSSVITIACSLKSGASPA